MIRKAITETVSERPYLLGIAGSIAAQGSALLLWGNSAYHPQQYMLINEVAAVIGFSYNLGNATPVYSAGKVIKPFLKSAISYVANGLATLAPLLALENGYGSSLAIWPAAIAVIGVTSWYSGKQTYAGIATVLENKINSGRPLTLDDKKRAKAMVLQRFLRETRFMDARSDFHTIDEGERAMMKALGQIRIKTDAL
jgi:hypothetical protein